MRSRLLAFLILLPTLALAQAPSTSVIPYSGTLFSQGKPVSQDSDVLMAFALYSGDAVIALPAGSINEAPDVALADENPSYNRLWTSWTTEDGAASQLSSLTGDNPDTVGVKVRNGRFLVHLGASGQTALPNSVFDQRPLYVVTWVVNASGVFRLPPQALDKVPHAVTAERANSFEVMGDLRFEGDLYTRDGGMIYAKNTAFISGYGTTNWDYLYHDDSSNTWHMVSDTAINIEDDRVPGNGKLRVGSIIINNSNSIKRSDGRTINFANVTNVPWTALGITRSQCYTGGAVSRQCLTGIHRYCREQAGYVSGFGPVEDNGQGIDTWIVCVGAD